MPVINVRNKILLIHGGHTIFHDYKGSDYPVDEPMTYHYATDEMGDNTFDVRDLPNPDGLEEHEDIIVAAIESGDIELDTQFEDENEYALSLGQQTLLNTWRASGKASHVDDIPDTLSAEKALLLDVAQDIHNEADIALIKDMALDRITACEW